MEPQEIPGLPNSHLKFMMINVSAFNLDMSYSQLKSYKCAEGICIAGSCDHQLHFPLT